jgi:nitroreductase
MNLDAFEEMLLTRRSVRDFSPTVVQKELLERLLAITQRAPSAYNLQPVHRYVVTQRQQKEALLSACMNQPVILSAPSLIFFAGDKDAYIHHAQKTVEMDVASGTMSKERGEAYHLGMELWFSRKPLGFGWLTKLLLSPFLRFFTPFPSLPVVHMREWLSLEVGLSAMTFMLAAQSAGLATCPIKNFDENRVKKIIKIPSRHEVLLIVATGYPATLPALKNRLPSNDVNHWA